MPARDLDRTDDEPVLRRSLRAALYVRTAFDPMFAETLASRNYGRRELVSAQLCSVSGPNPRSRTRVRVPLWAWCAVQRRDDAPPMTEVYGVAGRLMLS